MWSLPKASERHMFDLSGPLHLTHVNWKNPEHRRSIAASLVQGVYVLQRTRKQKRPESEALATPWWEFFGFQLIHKLIDNHASIFGAIYQLKLPFSGQNYIDSDAPNIVIAFRGNVIKPDSFCRDLQLDFHFILNRLHSTSRFEIAMQAVRNNYSDTADLNFWLVGHSLGAALAMLSGKHMAKQGVFLKTFLFNPPFFSAPIERIKKKKVKKGIRIVKRLFTARLAIAVKDSQEDDSFAILSGWLPSLFVNPADHICSEYIGYFKHRQTMEDIGAGGIERLATKNSLRDLVLNAPGRESQSLHLIPSANLVVNLSPSPNFKHAHGIHQWWRQDLQLECKQYYYE